jgi:hypothetical protein
VLKSNKEMLGRAKAYRRLGRQKWVRLQSSLAAAGFEGHTGKYYEVKMGKKARKDQRQHPRRSAHT